MGMTGSGGSRGGRLGNQSEPLQRAADEGGGDGEAPGESGRHVLALRSESAHLASEVAAEALLELALDAEVLEVLAPAEQIQPGSPARRRERLAPEALAEAVDLGPEPEPGDDRGQLAAAKPECPGHAAQRAAVLGE